MNISKISREQIMEKACIITKEKGIHHLNIRELATATKVSVGSIYNYFPTKSQLIIAVVEDFWNHACTHEDLKNMPLDNFYHSYHLLYKKLYAYLQQFQGKWLHQLAVLDDDTKELGRKIEHDYFENIKKMLSIMLEKDLCIRKDIWNDDFSKQLFIDFLFRNTMNELAIGNEDPTFLIEILKKILQ